MKYFSLNGHGEEVDFKEALLNSIAPDKGLYFPSTIPVIKKEVLLAYKSLSKVDLCYEVIKEFVGDCIPPEDLRKIVAETIDFSTPVVPVCDNIYTLELFHGPTLAFKDVGARFMARCLQYFLKDSEKKTTILVATSGDTGGAVASGFLSVKNVNVVILYPKGKVSPLQEKQLTALGENITAIEVDGTFDDCQDLVKNAFVDSELKNKLGLTSANSINIARWLPQMFYYLNALQQIPENKRNVFCVPSGNFGNICAGLMTQRLGFPIDHFVAATNVNNVVPRYLESGTYQPTDTIPTISNAMDVSNPSNFIRIEKLFDSLDLLKQDFSSYSFTDEQTKAVMQKVYSYCGYVLDPHGAVGYLGIEKYLNSQKDPKGLTAIFLETAHPVKFMEVVKETLALDIPIPTHLLDLMGKEKISISSSTSYAKIKEILMAIS